MVSGGRMGGRMVRPPNMRQRPPLAPSLLPHPSSWFSRFLRLDALFDLVRWESHALEGGGIFGHFFHRNSLFLHLPSNACLFQIHINIQIIIFFISLREPLKLGMAELVIADERLAEQGGSGEGAPSSPSPLEVLSNFGGIRALFAWWNWTAAKAEG
jgi:hypothetical protein